MTAPASPLTGEALDAIEARLNVTRPDGSVLEWMRSIRQDQEGLIAEVRRLRAALEEISEGRGPFSRDQLTFCSNTVEAMKALALAALNPVQGES